MKAEKCRFCRKYFNKMTFFIKTKKINPFLANKAR